MSSHDMMRGLTMMIISSYCRFPNNLCMQTSFNSSGEKSLNDELRAPKINIKGEETNYSWVDGEGDARRVFPEGTLKELWRKTRSFRDSSMTKRNLRLWVLSHQENVETETWLSCIICLSFPTSWVTKPSRRSKIHTRSSVSRIKKFRFLSRLVHGKGSWGNEPRNRVRN